MTKLYTLKEIVDQLNDEFGNNPAHYQFTEERLRARIRSAKARGIIKPQRMGYDRRTNYFTEEDVERIKATWIGPELPEFTEYEADAAIINPEEEEITVRAAKVSDVDAIVSLLPASIPNETKEQFKPYVSKMLRSNPSASFVAVLNENDIIGWAQAEISVGTSLIRAQITGVIHLVVDVQRRDAPIAIRSLFHRADSWLGKLNIPDIVLEIADTAGSANDNIFESLALRPETRMRTLVR